MTGYYWNYKQNCPLIYKQSKWIRTSNKINRFWFTSDNLEYDHRYIKITGKNNYSIFEASLIVESFYECNNNKQVFVF